MSYAIPADEPDGVTPAVLSAMVHLALLAVLIFGLRRVAGERTACAHDRTEA